MKLKNKMKLIVSLLVMLTLFSVPASSYLSLNDKDYAGDISGFAKCITEISPVAYQSEKEEMNKNENKDEQKETEEMEEAVLTETPSEAETSETEIYTNKNLYIEDTLLLGNSLVVGIESVSQNKPEVISEIGLNLTGMKKYYNKIKNTDFKNVIIEMGTNELGWDDVKFKTHYQNLIDFIKEINEECFIFLVSIPPVSKEKSQSNNTYTNKNVKRLNAVVKSLCEENNLKYIDCSNFFGEELSANMTGDGIHLNSSGYYNWYQYICECVGIANA